MKLIKTGELILMSLAKKGLTALILLWSISVAAQNPSASFTSNKFSGCAPLSVDFTNLSSNATSYFWDFGNGNTSVLSDPTTVYLTPGYYTVTLVAINNANGLRDTLVATNFIHVVDDPVPDFTANPLSGCAGNNFIAFSNLSTNATSFIWDFGDGSFSTQYSPVHNYTNPGTYTVKLIARNAYSCTKVKVRTAYITIVPNPPASFNASPQSSCDPATLFQFNATTAGAVAWQWNFGDGTTSSAQNPTHVYGAQGSYDVTLIVTNASGCMDTLVKNAFINIGASLVPTFDVNAQTGCPPFNAQFTSTVPNATSWDWDFGDGTTASSENPSHLYTSSGYYTITLTVTTTSGCNGTAIYNNYIQVDTVPVPSFTATPSSGCAPVLVNFTNTTQFGATYTWDLGNGTLLNDTNTQYTYSSAGVYPVTLTATSANGCTETITDSAAVTVNDIVATINGTPRIGCAPLAVTANGTSTPSAVSWQWDMGDGTTGTGASFPHVYNNIGNYTVTLIATSAAGCTDTVVKPSFFKVVDDTTIYTVPDTMLVCLPPGAVSFNDPTIGSNSWVWYWGNGDSSTVKNPTYTYTNPGIYTVSLVAGMAGGCTQHIDPIAYVEVVPFIVSPITSVIISPCGPFTVALDNQTLNVASYLWDFGDGNTSTQQNPVHTYASAGTYTISLLITSVNGCQTSLTTTVTFGHANPIVTTPNAACLGAVMNFSLTPTAAFTAATWDFGDGNTASGLSPGHSYSITGSYQVAVTVTDTNGCVFTYNNNVLIDITDPQASFSVNQPLVGCAPFNVQFQNTSTGAIDYLWIFGDGDSSIAVSPSHNYTAAGVYTVTLIASTPGCTDSVVMVNYVTVNAAIANFNFTPTSGCLPLTVNFNDLSISPVSWFWDFGDGNTSTQQNPVHTFATEPTSQVTLTIVDINGCTKLKRKLNVEIIKPEIIVDDSTGCRPLTVTFSTTTPATSYLWDFGDGTTSVQQNPVHTYTQTGSFTVSLSTVLASGCTTSLVKPNFITVNAPVADFMSPTVAVCAPSLVNFVNQSSGATSYLWDFGDGSSSVSQDPSHIYNAPGAYTIRLIAFSTAGCTDTIIKADYIIVPGTLTQFEPSDTLGCENSTIQFTDQSLNATQWFWDFGDGTTASTQNPTHVYSTAGSYTVTLITNDSVGCSSFYAYPVPIQINPMPAAIAGVSGSSGCAPYAVSFTNNSNGAASFQWYFGDGATSTDSLPTHTYNTPGIYQPYLVASTAFGCTDTSYIAGGVTVYTTPVASFLRSKSVGCGPLTVDFTNQSSLLNGQTWIWDFGNGQTATTLDASMTFVNPGTYTVSLTVNNTGGCTSTFTRQITVYPTPTANGTISTLNGCSPLQVVFNDLSAGADNILWDFGNGNTSTTASPSVTYTTGGNYQITLIATTVNGCADTLVFPNPVIVAQSPIASFNRNPVSGCTPINVTITNNSSGLFNPAYLWDFGNGQTSAQAAPVITYTGPGTYPIFLTVTNQNGCSDTITKYVTAENVPTAIASLDDSTGCGSVTVSFKNSSVNANGYAWNFGDGGSSIQINPIHTYTTPGVYYITLIAYSSTGCTDTLVLPTPVTVLQEPIASFTVDKVSGCTPLPISINNLSSSLLNPSYTWDFDNGFTSNVQTPSLVYDSGGSYDISLVVRNANGCADSTSKHVNVYDTPVANATTADTAGCHQYSSSFTNLSTGAAAYSWSFGDGATSVASNPMHTYSTPGLYTVTLIASGSGNCADTLVLPQQIKVFRTPVAAFTPDVTLGCTDLVVNFANSSTSLDNPVYSWSFGNGQNSSQSAGVATYTQAGIFPVSLIVTNTGGCADTATASITVNQSPQANAFVTISGHCKPVTVDFQNASTAADSYLWVLGDGTTSTQPDLQHIYNTSGTYNAYLVAATNAGCSDTFFVVPPIVVDNVPTAAFTVNQTAGCSGTTFNFINNSFPATGLNYLWTIAGNTYTSANPAVNIIAPGVHGVTLIVTNAGGCSDTVSDPYYIQVYDTLPPPVSPILSVSVKTNTQVEIIWQNNATLDLGAYVLYRLNPSTNQFVEIYRDLNPQNSATNVTSTYVDNGLNTLSNTYTYLLETVDQCNNALPLSYLTPHTTINVTAGAVGQSVLVQWTPYGGCPVNAYEIYRIEGSSGTPLLVKNVPPGTLSWLDTTFYCPGQYSYRITATDLCGTTYTSLSDTAVANPASPLVGQVVDIVRSTVVDDRDVLTEWLPPAIAPNRVVEYLLYRSTDSSSFQFVTAIPASGLSYLDTDVDVHQQNYYYRIEVVNDCQVQTPQSNRSSSILLNSEFERDKAHLWWTRYIYWDQDVDYYIIEKEVAPGIWDPVKTVPGNQTDTFVDY